MVRLPLDCPDANILAVAEEWTNCLAAGDYAGACEMLLHNPAYPGRSWVADPNALRAWVVNYGSPEPVPGEPVCLVTPTATATGARWRWLPSLNRAPEGNPHLYPAFRGRLDWQLPLNGEWSDLVASFDLVEHDGALVFVLAALRVP